MKSKHGPQLDCLRRALKRGCEVFINNGSDLILQRRGKELRVPYAAFNLAWLNKEFPIRPDFSVVELIARWHELIAWDHSFTYKTADMRYDASCSRPYFFMDFPWASAAPDMFE